VVLPANVFSTRDSISVASGARLARIGTAIVDTSAGGGATAGLAASAGGGATGRVHATMNASGNNHPQTCALQLANMSDTTTFGIRIQVESEYLADRSDRDTFTFAYHVKISNVGEEPAQLLSREWIITDENGHVERVQGPGVVGEFPVLAPGESFEYQSFCPLKTAMGTMHGSYTMRRPSGQQFDAEIAPFTLAVPGVVN
jgi:ApaG protein